jgi:phosphate transport system substrate-binding protein
VAPVVNLEGIGPGQLRLTGSVLADIYLGKITKWNAEAISELNELWTKVGDGVRG